MLVSAGEKPFVCPYVGCGRSFTTSNIRKVHIRTHTGERPYSCHIPDCGKTFASATNFRNHIRIHSGSRCLLPFVIVVEFALIFLTNLLVAHSHAQCGSGAVE